MGTGVMLGGQCAIRDHVTLGDGAMVAACSGVAEDVNPKVRRQVAYPPSPHRQTLREQAACGGCRIWWCQLRKLQEEVEKRKSREDLSRLMHPGTVRCKYIAPGLPGET